MLVGLLNIVFSVLIFLVRVASWLMLIYVVLSWILPQNKYTLLIGKYVEPLLAPVRTLIGRFLPSLAKLHVDVSPIGLWLLLNIAEWLLRLLKGILL